MNMCPFATKTDCELFGKIHTYNGTKPPQSLGEDWDWCVTNDGIYEKKYAITPAGFLCTSSNPIYEGTYSNMGVNTVISNNSGNPNGTHYFYNEAKRMVLCWNTAYSNYWWISPVQPPYGQNEINQALKLDNGQASAYCGSGVPQPATPQTLPPNSGGMPSWNSMSGSVTMTWASGGSGVLELQWVKMPNAGAVQLYRRS